MHQTFKQKSAYKKNRDAIGYCFHLHVNRFHLPVNYRLTDNNKNIS